MKIFSIEILFLTIVLINAISARSLFKKRSDTEGEAPTGGEETAYEDEKSNTEDTESEIPQADAEITKSSDEKQEIKLELLNEVENNENEPKEIKQEDASENVEEDLKQTKDELSLEKETNPKSTEAIKEEAPIVDSNDKEDDFKISEVSKEDKFLDDVKETETTSSKLEKDDKSDLIVETLDDENKEDSKVTATNLKEKVTDDEGDENKSESAERSDSSNKPHIFKEPNDKQPLAGEKEEKANSTAWFNINPLYLIIPILILALIVVALAVFALYKKNIIFKKKADRNDSLPKRSAVYSPVTQTDSK
jgi:hypothetical protein